MAKKQAKKKTAVKKGSDPLERVPRKEIYTAQRLSAHVERIREQAARLSGLARSMEDAGVEEILVAGERSHRTAVENRRLGIPIGDATLAEIATLASEYGIPINL